MIRQRHRSSAGVSSVEEPRPGARRSNSRSSRSNAAGRSRSQVSAVACRLDVVGQLNSGKLLVELEGAVFDLPVGQVAAAPQPVGTLGHLEHPQQVPPHDVRQPAIVLQHRARRVIRVAVPRQRQQHVISQNAARLADRDGQHPPVGQRTPHGAIVRQTGQGARPIRSRPVQTSRRIARQPHRRLARRTCRQAEAIDERRRARPPGDVHLERAVRAALPRIARQKAGNCRSPRQSRILDGEHAVLEAGDDRASRHGHRPALSELGVGAALQRQPPRHGAASSSVQRWNAPPPAAQAIIPAWEPSASASRTGSAPDSSAAACS